MRSMGIVGMVLAAAAGVAVSGPVAGAGQAGAGEGPARFGPAETRPGGVVVCAVGSPRQGPGTELHLLLPERARRGEVCRVLYVLPVEPRDGRRWGDALGEIRRLDLHNRYGLICAYPTFSHLPWYADHPTDPAIRQESYLLKDILPFVERTFPVVGGRAGRLLVGFSKSGWGAWSLLLRHPGLFEKAAAWDAPLAQAAPDAFGMRGIFGTAENFRGYRILGLLEAQADKLRGGKRLGLFGYGGFRRHHQRVHERMVALGIPHAYRDGPARRHHWAGGWLAEAVAFLARREERQGASTRPGRGGAGAGGEP